MTKRERKKRQQEQNDRQVVKILQLASKNVNINYYILKQEKNGENKKMEI